MTRYRTIVADPPWHYDGMLGGHSRTPGKWEGAYESVPLPYQTMSVGEIADLPVSEWALTDARLFLWTTNRYLHDAFHVAEAWGFAYKQTLTWHKPDAFAGSVAPNSEFLLVAARGTPGRINRLASSVIAHSQTKTHSRKPDVFLDLVEQVSPGPYLELFARRQRLGWDTWGDEALEHVRMGA